MANYAGQSAFWGLITKLSNAALVSMDTLYIQGLCRLQDGLNWLRDQDVRDRAALASATLGTPGKITGSVDLTGLVFDATSGALNGLTFQIASNTSGTVTVTFGTGSLAPTGPGDVVTQINTASSSDPLASVDAAGHLSVQSVTTGGSGTINVVGGSAVTLLGFTVAQNATGVASGGDGATAVGVAAISGTGISFAGGTLRALLTAIAAAPSLQAGGHYALSSRSVTRSVPPIFALNSTNAVYVTVVTVAADDSAQMPINLPHGATLTHASFVVNPVNATPPGGVSVIGTVVKRNLATGVTTNIVSTTDPTAGAAYGPHHVFNTATVADVVDRATYSYHAFLTGETGGGKNSADWFGITVTLTVTAIDDAPF